MRRLKQLESENARLKKLVAERDLEIEVMKEITAKKMVSVPARREQVAYETGRRLSKMRACTLAQVGRSALRSRSKMAVRDAPVVKRMAELAAQYPRNGYRRIRIFLGRDGIAMSVGRAHRLWRMARLQVPRKRPCKRIASGRPRRTHRAVTTRSGGRSFRAQSLAAQSHGGVRRSGRLPRD